MNYSTRWLKEFYELITKFAKGKVVQLINYVRKNKSISDIPYVKNFSFCSIKLDF
jgi:hypothetical protein